MFARRFKNILPFYFVFCTGEDLCFLMIGLQFLHFEGRFWRMVERKNSGKNSKYSFDNDLLIESFNEKFRALADP